VAAGRVCVGFIDICFLLVLLKSVARLMYQSVAVDAPVIVVLFLHGLHVCHRPHGSKTLLIKTQSLNEEDFFIRAMYKRSY